MHRLFVTLLDKVRTPGLGVKPVAMINYINLRTGYCGILVARDHLTIHARGRLADQRFTEWTYDATWGRRGEGGSIKIRDENELDSHVIGWIRSALTM